MFNFKRANPPDSQNLSELCFIQSQRNFENQTVGFCSVVYQTSGVSWGHTVDLQKALEIIKHSISLEKLEHYEI